MNVNGIFNTQQPQTTAGTQPTKPTAASSNTGNIFPANNSKLPPQPPVTKTFTADTEAGIGSTVTTTVVINEDGSKTETEYAIGENGGYETTITHNGDTETIRIESWSADGSQKETITASNGYVQSEFCDRQSS